MNGATTFRAVRTLGYDLRFSFRRTSRSWSRCSAACRACGVASTPQGQFEKTFQVSGPVDLEVQTHSGDITVRSWTGGLGLRSRQDLCRRPLAVRKPARRRKRHRTASSPAAGRQQHPHRLCERSRHFGGLRNHRACRHHHPHPQRLGRSDDRRHSWQRRPAERIGRHEAHADHR